MFENHTRVTAKGLERCELWTSHISGGETVLVSTPTQPPEGALLERLRTELRPTLSGRAAAKASGISASRWTQIIRGYKQETPELRVPVRAPDKTLARMAKVVGATPDQLREVGREDAAEELEGLMTAREYVAYQRSGGSTSGRLGRGLAAIIPTGPAHSPLTVHDEHFDRAERLLNHARESVRDRDHLGAINGLEGVQSTVELLIDRITGTAANQSGFQQQDQGWGPYLSDPGEVEPPRLVVVRMNNGPLADQAAIVPKADFDNRPPWSDVELVQELPAGTLIDTTSDEPIGLVIQTYQRDNKTPDGPPLAVAPSRLEQIPLGARVDIIWPLHAADEGSAEELPTAARRTPSGHQKGQSDQGVPGGDEGLD